MSVSRQWSGPYFFSGPAQCGPQIMSPRPRRSPVVDLFWTALPAIRAMTDGASYFRECVSTFLQLANDRLSASGPSSFGERRFMVLYHQSTFIPSPQYVGQAKTQHIASKPDYVSVQPFLLRSFLCAISYALPPFSLSLSLRACCAAAKKRFKRILGNFPFHFELIEGEEKNGRGPLPFFRRVKTT